MTDDIVARLRDWANNSVGCNPANAPCGQAADEIERLRAAVQRQASEPPRRWRIGDRVRKKSGAQWRGHVVGFYMTSLTPIGYAIESEREVGSVQIYPQSALEDVSDEL